MHTDNMGVKLFFFYSIYYLLNLSVFMVYHFSPIYEYIDLPGRDLYFFMPTFANYSLMFCIRKETIRISTCTGLKRSVYVLLFF